MDQLEKLIIENKAQFNDHLPSPDVWMSIEKKIGEEKAKRFSITKFFGSGVAAIGLLLMGVWFGINFKVDDMDRAISNSSFADYKQTEQYYSMQVKSYVQEINELDAAVKIEDELKQLDEVYEELRDELINAEIRNQDVIINAMINNYQIKIGMLERILDKTKVKALHNDINNPKDEKISI